MPGCGLTVLPPALTRAFLCGVQTLLVSGLLSCVGPAHHSELYFPYSRSQKLPQAASLPAWAGPGPDFLPLPPTTLQR